MPRLEPKRIIWAVILLMRLSARFDDTLAYFQGDQRARAMVGRERGF